MPYSSKSEPRQPVPSGTTILFQGDSITDAGRDRARYYPNDTRGLGVGYVYQIVADIMAHHPGDQLRCYNRGISGNKVYQLAERWDDDCLQLQPQVLSILIGVNDFWHTLRSDYEGTPEVFNHDLRALLIQTKEQLPDIKIILGEPFAVKGGSAITAEWSQGFRPYQNVVKEISDDLGTAFVPYQQVFDEALEKAPADHWCPDGVHPSIAGAFLMKDAWLQAFHKLI
ncbi:MAG: lipase [Cyclobacteriaceae bacterium]|nr:MAG: lipase [Cyclobacteriaceae bacterium]